LYVPVHDWSIKDILHQPFWTLHSPTWESVEIISREKMEQLQVDRLRDCVANVKKQVGFYRNLLTGTVPKDIRSLSDLTQAASVPHRT